MGEIDENIKEIFEEIEREVLKLHVRWKLYRTLYGTSEERMDLLNEVDPELFHHFQFCLIDYVVLSLSRLTDPRGSNQRENLSFANLLSKIPDVPLVEELTPKIESYADSCATFKTLRNKQIAHNDLHYALGLTDEVLPGVSRKDVEVALEIVRSIMNTINGYYKDSETIYTHIITYYNAGDRLLNCLQKGLAYDAESKSDDD